MKPTSSGAQSDAKSGQRNDLGQMTREPTDRSAAKSAAFDQNVAADSQRSDSDLQAVVDAWHRLPEAVRVGIVAMVNATSRTASQGIAKRE